ncbi:hypothetical protein [Burkholderia glumae]|uniref:Uncharacterized protein n=1 Tax=Burkholderia glumae TaxID=337 RepID=A0AAP9Y5B0_BURGL|nr:hypothetical protein [Burkholderia glumae]MCM2485724.1 hypothetical protein [Burkholderia glumae]MCM2511505.1 hypothetical protein [Burkholderia glumae]MCM2540488.1 hypothetical protein [Burkholderia glumae]QGA41814.1 hypothetical protein GAS19_30545 [Burkholderia glumae]QPQ94876.1 hypothetical protein I6H06_29440 [Burkholderia glumae]
MTSFLLWKPFSQVSTDPKITGQVSGSSLIRQFLINRPVCIEHQINHSPSAQGILDSRTNTND